MREFMELSMVTEKRPSLSAHFKDWPSRMGWVFVVSVFLIGGILAGCSAFPVNKYHTLNLSELEDKITHKTKQLKMLETERQEQIRQRGSADLSTEGRIRQIENEITMLVRWRRRLMLQERSGRYSGPR